MIHGDIRDLSPIIRSRQKAYRELFRYELEPGLVDSIREATNGYYPLGTPKLCDQVSLALGRSAVRGKGGPAKGRCRQ